LPSWRVENCQNGLHVFYKRFIDEILGIWLCDTDPIRERKLDCLPGRLANMAWP
jgi:hypothetical protein